MSFVKIMENRDFAAQLWLKFSELSLNLRDSYWFKIRVNLVFWQSGNVATQVRYSHLWHDSEHPVWKPPDVRAEDWSRLAVAEYAFPDGRHLDRISFYSEIIWTALKPKGPQRKGPLICGFFASSFGKYSLPRKMISKGNKLQHPTSNQIFSMAEE